MEKYFCIEIHTERLHDDKSWKKTLSILDYFSKNNIQATWFSINPTFVGYQAMHFDEDKWRERLESIKNFSQDIQQHTHFYKGKVGVPKGEGYDMTAGHMRERLLADKQWLEDQGFDIKGFVSGSWRINDELFKALRSLGYKYDSSIKGRDIGDKFGLLEIPVSSKVRKLIKAIFTANTKKEFLNQNNEKTCIISFHDYDLESMRFRLALLLVLRVFQIMHFNFVSTSTIYEKFKLQQ